MAAEWKKNEENDNDTVERKKKYEIENEFAKRCRRLTRERERKS